MTKKLVIAIVCSALLTCFTVLGCFFIHPRSNQPVVIIENLRFGMSPSDVEALLGAPNEAKNSIHSSKISVYYYDIQVDGLETQLQLGFIRVGLRKQLYQVDASICITENSSGIQSDLRQQIYDTYSEQEGFFSNSRTLGVRKGAYGTSFSIEQSGTYIRVSGYCDEYEKLFFE